MLAIEMRRYIERGAKRMISTSWKGHPALPLYDWCGLKQLPVEVFQIDLLDQYTGELTGLAEMKTSRMAQMTEYWNSLPNFFRGKIELVEVEASEVGRKTFKKYERALKDTTLKTFISFDEKETRKVGYSLEEFLSNGMWSAEYLVLYKGELYGNVSIMFEVNDSKGGINMWVQDLHLVDIPEGKAAVELINHITALMMPMMLEKHDATQLRWTLERGGIYDLIAEDLEKKMLFEHTNIVVMKWTTMKQY
jgi:hypothetical protein